MKRLILALISLFKTGGKTKTGKVVAKDLVYVTKLKTIANWRYSDPVLYKTWLALPKSQQTSYLRQIKQGKLTTKQLETEIRVYGDIIAPAKINFTVKHGIKFAENELSAINTTSELLANMINNKQNLIKYRKGFNITLPTEFEIRSNKAVRGPVQMRRRPGSGKYVPTPGKLGFPEGQSTMQSQVTVYVVPYDHAKTLYPGLDKYTRGWANPTTSTEFYLVWEHFTEEKLKTWATQLADIKSVMTHEIAHIKDPSIVAAPKLRAKYDPTAPYVGDTNLSLAKKAAPNWKKNYYYHQFEILANLSPILSAMTSNTRIILRSAGKKKTLVALNQLSQWAASGTMVRSFMKDLNAESVYILTGFRQPSVLYNPVVKFFNQFKTEHPAEYKKVVNKLARQIESLKQQVKDTKNLTPESVIKLNTKLGFAK